MRAQGGFEFTGMCPIANVRAMVLLDLFVAAAFFRAQGGYANRRCVHWRIGHRFDFLLLLGEALAQENQWS
jgi:hypothetical protein